MSNGKCLQTPTLILLLSFPLRALLGMEAPT